MPKPPDGVTPPREEIISYASSESAALAPPLPRPCAALAPQLRDAADARLGRGRAYFDTRNAPTRKDVVSDALGALLEPRGRELGTEHLKKARLAQQSGLESLEQGMPQMAAGETGAPQHRTMKQ